MRSVKVILPLLLLLTALFSCNKELNVNANWKDITVVYGLLDQSADTTFIKITKAFLGPGDALKFSKIADSSTYPDKLEVRLDEYNGSLFVNSYSCDTITIRNKQKGDSIFYYPNQLMYYTKAKLNENYRYNLYIRNKKTGKLITSQTLLIHDFEIMRPQINSQITFTPGGHMTEVRWAPAKNAKRYQLMIRFFYVQFPKSGVQKKDTNYIDWVVDNKIMALDAQSTQPFDEYFPDDGFYSVVGGLLDTTTVLTRVAYKCQFIFSVASDTLNTYMEVTEPSLSLVQEKPAFTDISNGLGLFSARYTKVVDSIFPSAQTKAYLKTNVYTIGHGF